MLDAIVKRGNHYLVKVKGNCPALKTSLEQIVRSGKPAALSSTQETRRGRNEVRKAFLFKCQGALPAGWESIRTVVCLHRHFLSKKKEHITKSLYVTDLDTADAALLNRLIRSHWLIENKLHYTKDVIMKEDERSTKNKNAAANLALFRDFAFNLLKNKNPSIKYATEFFANKNVKDLFLFLIRT